MKCSNCQGPLEVGQQFCPQCGQPAPKKEPEYCQYCNTEIKEGQRFCTGCGRPVEQALATNACVSCGATLAPGTLFCPECGTQQISPSGSSAETKASVPVTTVKEDLPEEQKKPEIPTVSQREDRPFSVVVGDDDFLETPLVFHKKGEKPSTPAPPPFTSPRREEKETAEPFDSVEEPSAPVSTVLEPPEQEVFAAETDETLQQTPPVKEEAFAPEFSPEAEKTPAIDSAEPMDTPEETVDEPLYAVEHTPETQRSMKAMEELIAELEDKESLPQGHQPVETIVEDTEKDSGKGKKKRKKKKEKQADAVSRPITEDTDQPKGTEVEEKEQGGGLRTFLFMLLVIAVALAIAVTALYFLKQKDIELQEAALSSTMELEEQILQESNLEGVDSTPSSATVSDAEIVESDDVLVVGYHIDTIGALQWDMAYPFDNEETGVVVKDTLYGLMNNAGELVLEPEHQEISSFSEGLAAYRSEDLWGYLDALGEEIIYPAYEAAGAFSQGVAWVKQGEFYGAIDTTGETVVPFEYTQVSDFSEGYAAVSQGDDFFYIDIQGKALPGFYQKATPFSEGFAAVKKGDVWGYIDASGQESIDFFYQKALPFSQGYAAVEQQGSMFLIDTLGELSSPKVEELHSLGEDGLALAKSNGRYGYLAGGEETFVIPPEYENALSFSEGFAAVSKTGGRWQYIDRENNLLATEHFAQAHSFENGLAHVVIGNQHFLMDGRGDFVDQRYWQDIGSYAYEIVPVKSEENWGYLGVYRITTSASPEE